MTGRGVPPDLTIVKAFTKRDTAVRVAMCHVAHCNSLAGAAAAREREGAARHIGARAGDIVFLHAKSRSRTADPTLYHGGRRPRGLHRRPEMTNQFVKPLGDLPERAVLDSLDELREHVAAVFDDLRQLV